MKAIAPWNGMTGLRREMDRLFDRFWEGESTELPALTEWRPAMEVSETKDFVVVKAEIPGIDPKEIKVNLANQVLTIEGEKKQDREEKDERFYRFERTYGSFCRSLRLPAPVDEGKVKASFKDGLLRILLPKVAAAKGMTIPVELQ
jgi:HSP20 family protein